MPITDGRFLVIGDPSSPLTLNNGVQYRSFRISGTPADQNLFPSDEAWKLISAKYTSNAPGTDAGAVTGLLTKCTGTTAPAAGIALQTGTFDLKTAAHNTVNATLVSNQSALTFAAGDRLALDVTGVTTAVDGVITIGYQRA
ncbi:hypothetical protein H6F86_20465 [Phormidium sp. FACHB-592]|uniref:Uncharacterized protein n=1 Tax=Stenomitos frigidus AS-A4 TaxID=2933935 RepID=A0ABV0KED5_9CYAN|nr:hypothetical protein [Phormidium sp. FACHB-592]MBD2076206.1 hypothetical protein [Phormidium sp. FACHB-592]